MRLTSRFNAKAGFADLWDYLREPRPYRWPLLAVSFAIPLGGLLALTQESHFRPPDAPKVSYISTFAEGRSDEEIRQVIDQHMGAIFAIYNRALRQDPLLQGKLVVRMVIEPSGEISEARIESSELNNEELEQRLLARILLITFPDADVTVTQVNYTFDFLPR